MSLKQRSRRLAKKRFWEQHNHDEYTCPDCGRSVDEIYSDSFEVHHEDGDAFNNSLDNLVGLCSVCHNLREGKRPGPDAVKALRDNRVSTQTNGQPEHDQMGVSADGSGAQLPVGESDGEHQTTFEKVGMATTRDQKGSIVIPVESAVNQSGNAGGNGIRFTRSGEFVLTGEVIDEKPDGRKHKLARAINRFGAGGTKSVALPTAGLEHLVIDRDEAADGVDLELWVCTDPDEDRPLIAVTPVIKREMQFVIPERDDK